LFVVVLSSLILFVIFDSIKQSFLNKLQIRKTFVKDKIYKILLLLFSITSTENIYNIDIAKKISKYLSNIINIQITKVAEKDI